MISTKLLLLVAFLLLCITSSHAGDTEHNRSLKKSKAPKGTKAPKNKKGKKSKAPKGKKSKAPKGKKSKAPKGKKSKAPKGKKSKAPKGPTSPPVEAIIEIPATESPSEMESFAPSWLIPTNCTVDEDCKDIDFYCAFATKCCQYNTTCHFGPAQPPQNAGKYSAVSTVACVAILAIALVL